ncbi:hypothetical protein Cni_G08473 [Canna indica]|uniref:Uncharacterized protein n=1 Tax=Canna indica TaxID=4628 RepID=A0AAQ3K4A0_9LILI|nr:hypothetical protein Cni_G08473 [Canna indica]
MDCDENCKKTNNKIAVNCDDGFVSLNVVELIAATDPHHSAISPAPATPSAAPVLMKKSLSRKLGVAGPPQRSAGSQAVVGAHAGGTNYGRDKPPDEGEASAAGAGGRCRRASAVHRPSPWRDPRTILLLFASLGERSICRSRCR